MSDTVQPGYGASPNFYQSPGNGYGVSNLNDKPTTSTSKSSAPGVGSFTGLNSINPYEDPAFGAYMRGIGLDENNMRAEMALRNNRLTQQFDQQQPQYAEQLENGTRQIGTNAEDRGTFNSGRRIADQTQFAGDVANSQLAFANNIAGQRDDLQFQLASQIATDRAQQGEQALNAQKNIALLKAQAGMYQ